MSLRARVQGKPQEMSLDRGGGCVKEEGAQPCTRQMERTGRDEGPPLHLGDQSKRYMSNHGRGES